MAQVISTSAMSRAFLLSSHHTQASSPRYAVRSLLLRSSIPSHSSLSPSLRSSRLCTSPRQSSGSRRVPLCSASAPTDAHAETGVWNGVLSKEKVELIQGSYGDVEGKISAEGFGKEFYDVLFEQVPESKALFTRVSRSVQEKMFGDLLKLLIGDLSNADTAVAALKATATRHGKYGVVEAHFPVVGAALLTTLERCLGPAFTPATKEAWAELWATATNVMWSQIAADRAAVEN